MKKLLSLVLFFSFQTLVGQNLITYQLEAQMDASAQLWNNDSLIIWGFRDLNNPNMLQASLPGPTIYCEEGDSVVITMTNPSFEAHTIHLHGLDVDQNNDGVPSTSFFVQPNEIGTYSFKADYSGNFLYHCHVGTVLHLQMGMYGAVIVKAQNGAKEVYTGGPQFDREFMWLAHEVDKSWHDDYTAIGAFTNYFPDHFQINGKSRQLISRDSSISVYNAFAGEKLLIRLLNVGYGLNRYIFPANSNVQVLTSDGRVLDQPFVADTIEVFPGERFGVLVEPNQLIQDSVRVEYLSMYRKKFWAVEKIPFQVNALNPIAQTNNNEIEIYPNPTTDQIFIKGAGKRIAKLFDLNGRLLCEKNLDGSSAMSLKKHPDGAYIIKVIEAGGAYNSDIIIKKPHR